MSIINIPFNIDTQILFFGHIHRSRIFVEEENEKKTQLDFTFNEEFKLNNKRYWINVGSVWVDRVWCLYDSAKSTITFMSTLE